MHLPGIEVLKEMLVEQIEFLKRSCKSGIDPAELKEKIKSIRHLFRSAEMKHQIGYITTCYEAVEILEKDGSFNSCKLVMHATIFNLSCHLHYLYLKFPPPLWVSHIISGRVAVEVRIR